MAADIPSETPAVGSVLKGTKKKKAKVRTTGQGLNVFWFGVVFIVCGWMMILTIGGDFAKVGYMFGLGLFVLGILVQCSFLLYRIIRER